MELAYFKRYRMELDLRDRDVVPPVPSPPYRLLAWDPSLIEGFAVAKFVSFRYELDAHVFPCLGDLTGCRRLMHEIARKPGFLPETTWLITCPTPTGGVEYVGTIQGIRDREGHGAIQNLGVAPNHRNAGLGSLLLAQALDGFRRAGLERVQLEVTAQNEGAIRLYRRFGFAVVRTVFKAAEPAYA